MGKDPVVFVHALHAWLTKSDALCSWLIHGVKQRARSSKPQRTVGLHGDLRGVARPAFAVAEGDGEHLSFLPSPFSLFSDGGDGCFTCNMREWSGTVLPLSRSKLARMFLQGVAWLILDCARRTSTALNLNIRSISCAAFREQEDDQAASPHLVCASREHMD